MKTNIFFALLLTVCSAVATTVIFPVQSITGTANNQPVLVVPDSTTGQNGTNLLALSTQTLQPTNGVARANLVPWGYTLKIAGWPRTVHFNVNDTTNLVSVLSLITNGLVSYSPVRVGGWATNVDNATGTNVALIGPTFYPQFDNTNILQRQHNIFLSYRGGINNGFYDTNYPNAGFIFDTRQNTDSGNQYIRQNISARTALTNADNPTVFLTLNYDPSGVLPNYIELRMSTVFNGSWMSFGGATVSNAVFDTTCTVPASIITGGITTNLQFTFNSSRTNTLYFTNGILMRVSQP
jgi:hypothetical protein